MFGVIKKVHFMVEGISQIQVEQNSNKMSREKNNEMSQLYLTYQIFVFSSLRGVFLADIKKYLK